MAAAQQGQRRDRGTEHGDAVLMRRAARQGGADIVDGGRIGPGDDQRGQPADRAACRRRARSASSAATKRSRSPDTSACITGCSGTWVCTSARPGRSCAAGAAGDLVEQLEGALGGAQVAAVQAEIGIDHGDQGEVGEVMALGRHLGADQDVDLARDPCARPPRSPRRGSSGVSEVNSSSRASGNSAERLLGQPLDARAAGDEAGRRRRSTCRHAPAARHSRSDGRPACGGSDARPARPSIAGIRCRGRRRGTASAAHSRGD